MRPCPPYAFKVRASVAGSTSTSIADVIINIENTDEPPKFYSNAIRNIEQKIAYTAHTTSDAAANEVVSDIYIKDTEDQHIELLLVRGSTHYTSYEHSDFTLTEVQKNTHYQIRVKSRVILRERIITLHLLLRELNDNNPTTQEYMTRITAEITISKPTDTKPKFYADANHNTEQSTAYTAYINNQFRYIAKLF